MLHAWIKLFRKLSSKNSGWGVAYQHTHDWRDVTLWRSKRIVNPKYRFLADPFLIYREGKHYCFLEDFDYRSGLGSISVYEISKDGHKELGSALVEDFHLSYPYLFEYEDNLYMCPETGQANDIRIYKCIDFPMRWELNNIALANVNAADTNIFKKDDVWWLMTNISTSHVGEHGSELRVFSNDNPLDSNWKPHPKNPVIFDSLVARNGGLIECEDDIFRVHQRQGFDTYGEALGVSKILALDEESYAEQPLFEIEANFFDDIHGVHTYNYQKGLLVFDYAKVSNFKKVSMD